MLNELNRKYSSKIADMITFLENLIQGKAV
jgi:hypothetical protein